VFPPLCSLCYFFFLCFSSAAEPTFTRDIAPILFQHCAFCHRPGQSAPFNLLTFEDAKKRSHDIAKATRDRYMPPWLPAPGHGEFLNERRLTDTQIKLIQDWHSADAPEGNPADLPPAPAFEDGWLLGKPDLVVQFPAPYTLAADGPDLYRNFVVPAPLKEFRYIRAYEFRPQNRSVHHVRIQLDSTGQARRLDDKDPGVGFAGMRSPAKYPPGHMLTWIPGKSVVPDPHGLAWQLGAGVDLVFQIHFQRTGKPEQISPILGLYFTNQPPAKTSYVLGLSSQLIDIPAGATNHIEERSVTLPADVDVLGILPHLHYLGRRIHAFAKLPNGSTRDLILIPDWDFNWQDQYYYRTPVFLPAGATVTMRYSFDNSAQNPRNPNSPPRRVVYGPQSTDEMAELWLQLIPRNPADLPALRKLHLQSFDLETAAYYESQLRLKPDNAELHIALGKVIGPLGRLEEAIRHFQTAIQLAPTNPEAHYYLGLSLYTIRECSRASKPSSTSTPPTPKPSPASASSTSASTTPPSPNPPSAKPSPKTPTTPTPPKPSSS
jgi:hypothetical protein